MKIFGIRILRQRVTSIYSNNAVSMRENQSKIGKVSSLGTLERRTK